MSWPASPMWCWPSFCFLVQPAPATKSRAASGRIVCASAAGAWMPVTVVRWSSSEKLTATACALAAPAVPCHGALTPPSTRSTQGRAARLKEPRMRWR